MNQKILGVLLLLGSTMIYGLFGIFSRQIAEFGSFSQGWVRYSIVLLVILTMFACGKSKWKKIEKKDIKWFLTWILPVSFQPILSFIVITHLPIGITYFLIYSTMITGGIITGKIFFAAEIIIPLCFSATFSAFALAIFSARSSKFSSRIILSLISAGIIS